MCLLICLFFVRFVGVSVGSPGCSFAWFVGILLFGVVGGGYLTLWEIGWFWSVFVVGRCLDVLVGFVRCWMLFDVVCEVWWHLAQIVGAEGSVWRFFV